MTRVYKLYVPAGYWLVQAICDYCFQQNIGNADIRGIGSICNAWLLVNPNGTPLIKNFASNPSYEMTSLLGNITLRDGMPVYDPADLPTGKYPSFDTTVTTQNPYVHAHVTFANPDMTIVGGHLLDAQVSIGVELYLTAETDDLCVPGLADGQVISNCTFNQPVTIPQLGTFSNWDSRFWYSPSAS